MWCTRWYLPLVLLPIPIAPPYYLLLFLFSTTMHARPCFYCMVLLTAMFMSTCYWPPIPIETPLVRPWSENVTTFADALHLMLPSLPPEKVPSTIPVADRCWCDLSNGFFASFNTTKWEELSVVRLKDSLEREMTAEKKARERDECEAAAGEEVAQSLACNDGQKESDAPVPTPKPGIRLTLPELYIWQAFQALRPKSTHASAPPSTTSSVEDPQPPEEPSSTTELSTGSAAPTTTTGPGEYKKPPLLRREYDLRRFGFAMVLDFGWPTAFQP
ncbi:hypothetical protein C8Q80DRAFT_1282358 [Daedaleopsis nitida]|nr:hypothetical protein C8Q80DRAFT_1282358 [Daedaleopsis nitida]